jgi:hypothetical protein
MSDELPTMQWGWRIQCAHPGCECYLSEYEDGQTPGLPVVQGHEYNGWFWHASPRSTTWGYNYRVYCPDHAEAGKAWAKSLAFWERDRWAAGSRAAKTIRSKQDKGLLERFTDWLFNRKVAEKVQDWKEENPRPIPPWEQA